MSKETILGAAVALQEFSLSRLAAYCGEEPAVVEDVLKSVPSLVEAIRPQYWRVVDPAAIRTAIRNAESRESVFSQHRPALIRGGAELYARLVVAEETLVDCGAEDSPLLRQVMAASARNNVLQVLAQITPEQGRPWWSIEPFDSRWNATDMAVGGTLSFRRLRVDFELATMMAKEAAGESVSADDLVRTAVYLRDLLELLADGGRIDGLFQRFVDLSATLAEPAGLTAPSESAPTRLLVALAWHRARALATQAAGPASKTLVLILRQLQEELHKRHGHAAIDLYRFIEHLPDGQNRLVVYRDLLELLPRPLGCHTSGDFLPGVLVEAIADSQTSTHLEEIATRLQDDLDRSPFRSESALIGEAAHVLHDLAVNTADLDETILPRSDRMRRQLLSLVDAPV